MAMTPAPADPLAAEILGAISGWPIFDPHSHIDARSPAARTFDEVLGYHYYTELCHSAGMPAALVGPEVEPAERARNLAAHLDRIDNTIQHAWLAEIARTFHGWDRPIDAGSIDDLLARSDRRADGPAWDAEVWERSNLEAVFLTNDFDDPLDGWDAARYVPCLRTDDLVLKLHEPATVERLGRSTGVDVGDFDSLRDALGATFERFRARGARACAISLPADFAPSPATPRKAATPVRRAIRGMDQRPDEHDEVRRAVFWAIAELCDDFGMPFDLMIGPSRGVYPAGVAGGRDLFDRRTSLHDYRALFNHFAGVTFPVSTLAPDAGGELVAYSWIFPNVVPMGHWWYSNLPGYIAADLRARLEAVPKVKQVGYYSDAYKLEFILPKFNMYRRLLAAALADAARAGSWPVERAVDLARLVLLENPRRIFTPAGRSGR